LGFWPHLLLAVLEGTVAAAVLALSALGLSLVFGVMRVVNVAHGEFFMLGAMLAWWTAKMVPGGPLAGRHRRDRLGRASRRGHGPGRHLAARALAPGHG